MWPTYETSATVPDASWRIFPDARFRCCDHPHICRPDASVGSQTARGELSMFQSLRIASRSALTLIAALLACLPLSTMAAVTASRGDIVAVTVHGTVSATMAGMTVPLSAGAILQLPATVRTGPDGAVELRQGNSTFAAAGNTELEIPQSAAEDGLVERIVQIRGNAFYSI